MDADAAEESGHIPQPDAWVKPEDRPCMDGDQRLDPFVRATTVGADESRTDFCDDDGNLIDHECEVIEFADNVCGCMGECSCGAQVTGRILELPYDCEGDCIDGACIGWCPDGGDSLSITLGETLGTLEVENLTKSRRYACRLQDGAESYCDELESFVGTQESRYGYLCFGHDAGQPLYFVRPPPPPNTGDPWECPFECTRIEEP